jgi:hypothetical protein
MKYLLLIALVFSPLIHATSRITIGQTYEILEPDALLEISSQANKVNWTKKAETATQSALTGIKLPVSSDYHTRDYIPYYRIPADIRDDKGQIIYAKGYQYNPLEYTRLPLRVIVFTADMLDWVRLHQLTNDTLILSVGDTIKASKQLSAPVYLLDKRTIERLDIKKLPSIITKQKNKLVIEEYDYPAWRESHGF